MKQILTELAVKSSLYIHQFKINDPQGLTVYLKFIDNNPNPIGIEASLRKKIKTTTEYISDIILDGFAISGDITSSTVDYYPVLYCQPSDDHYWPIYAKQLQNNKLVDNKIIYYNLDLYNLKENITETIIPLNNTRQPFEPQQQPT